LKIPTGAGLSFRCEADDNDDIGGPKTGRSSEFFLRIATAEELQIDLLRREKGQRLELQRLLKDQQDLITDSQALMAALKDQTDLTAEKADQLLQFNKRQKDSAHSG